MQVVVRKNNVPVAKAQIRYFGTAGRGKIETNTLGTATIKALMSTITMIQVAVAGHPTKMYSGEDLQKNLLQVNY